MWAAPRKHEATQARASLSRSPGVGGGQAQADVPQGQRDLFPEVFSALVLSRATFSRRWDFVGHRRIQSILIPGSASQRQRQN